MNLALERQCFFNKAGESGYERLFRLMQPVQPVYWTRPGDPPRILHRVAFDDAQHNFDLRAERLLVKGRFQGGNVAYIHADELELFAGAYRKPIRFLSETEEILLRILDREGPLTIRILKEMTDMRVKDLAPVLHKFQEAFLVFEDQADNEWDRGWYLFEKEFPDVRPDRYTREEALAVLIPRFLHLHVFATAGMAASFYGLSQKPVKAALDHLAGTGAVTALRRDGEDGYVLTQDLAAVADSVHEPPVPAVFALQRNDFLVKSHQAWLDKAFSGGDHTILYYLLIDGRFQGVVQGTFRHGPNDLENVALMPDAESADRRDEILDAISVVEGDGRRLQRYCGERML